MTSHAPGCTRDHPKGMRVLVTDDNRDGANTLASLLASWGYEVHVAYDGLAALDAAESRPPDVAVIDLGLPGMDGYQVALHLRRRADVRNVRLIAITGFEWANARRRSLDYGFDAHLVKPIDPEQLRTLLLKFEHEHNKETQGNRAGVVG